ncbi:MAG: efflux RND transporter periplasmic adaptor subunit [Bacteroidales bacterium]|nr:efflux RND transporter periplasmic adaptor subunit [Bacteroidales bacterium]MCF8404133.1 efflux RND transporter periplasmic adaptor subunit [Bacteroidales bacterium]
MSKKIVFPLLLALIIAGCNSIKNHDHDSEADSHSLEEGHEHDDAKIQITAYSDHFEIFAEADPFVAGEVSNVLSHFSNLPDFSALTSGKVSLKIIIEGQETVSILEKPTRKGIYSFNIRPEVAGTGTLIYEIETDNGVFEISVPEFTVYSDDHDAIHSAEKLAQAFSSTNTSVFTKEQSWLVDFATEKPRVEAFGQIIKTTAQIKSAPADEVLVSARTHGMVSLTSINLSEGTGVSKGQSLFSISGENLSDNNSLVRFAEAKNNYEKAKTDYERVSALAKEKVISEKDLLTAKNQYDNTKLIFETLNKNFSSTGQLVTSPMTGFIKHIHVQNGEFVDAGQIVLSLSQNQSLILHAELQQKYASVLPSINSAVIRTLHDNKTYSLEELNGKILSYGRNTNSDNFLIPFSLQIDNKENFITGSFVELFLKSTSKEPALTLPNSALLEEQGNYFVFVQITPELFEKRVVKTGSQDGFRTEILDGISKDDRIVSKGGIYIKLARGTGTLDAHSGHVH